MRSRYGIAVISFSLLCSQLIGQEPSRPSPATLLSRTWESIRADNLPEADARIQLAVERGEPGEVPDSLFALARAYFRKEDWKNSLRCLKQITDEYPDDPVASLALLVTGEVYAKTGEKQRMVEVLERGISAPAIATNLNIMDASDTRNRAYQLLGQYYIDQKEWEKAIEKYREWQPSSWCGTCADHMEADRDNRIIFCLLHSGQSDEAAKACWAKVRKAGHFEIPLFVLLRLYIDAGQLNDFRQISDQIVQEALKAANESDGTPFGLTYAYTSQDERGKSVERVLRLHSSKHWADHIKVFVQPQDSRNRRDLHAFEVRAASWLIWRNREEAIPWVVRYFRSKDQKYIRLASFLAKDDSHEAREALAEIAAKKGGERQYICSVVQRYSPNPLAVLEQIVGTLPPERKAEMMRRDEPLPFTTRFSEEWPPPDQGSLPTVKDLKIRQVK